MNDNTNSSDNDILFRLDCDSILNNYVSLYECAALSSDAYITKVDKKVDLPRGWKRFADSGFNLNGYYGVCYIKEGYGTMVFAHRGTEPAIPGSAMNGIRTAFDLLPTQVDSAIIFENTVFERLSQLNPNIEPIVVQTGHSLGAIISDILGFSFSQPSITFENPGSKSMIINYLRQGVTNPASIIEVEELNEIFSISMRTYQADVNFINSLNEKAGKTFRLIDLPYDYKSITVTQDLIPTEFPNPTTVPREIKTPSIESLFVSESPLNWNYLFYTDQQHKIVNIAEYIKNNGRIVSGTNQAFGVGLGYAAYLDYSTRKQYWDEYAHSLWENSNVIRVKFENDESKFNDAFCERLNYCRDANNSNPMNLPSYFTIAPKSIYSNKSTLFDSTAQKVASESQCTEKVENKYISNTIGIKNII